MGICTLTPPHQEIEIANLKHQRSEAHVAPLGVDLATSDEGDLTLIERLTHSVLTSDPTSSR